MSAPDSVGATYLGHYFEFGDCGVDFFFVLSGFIIFQSNNKRFGVPSALSEYFIARFRRIYPLYWVVTLFYLLVFPLVVSGSFPSALDLVSSFTLIPHDEKTPVVLVAWTLEHEILFYALFALLIVDIRLGFAALSIWQALVCAALFGVFDNRFPASFLLKNVNLEFIFGALVFMCAERFKVAYYKVLALGGAAAFVAISPPAIHAAIYQSLGENARLLYGVAASTAILGWVKWERGGAIRVPAFLRLLGSASFAIYLVHIAVLALAIKAVIGLGLTRFIPLNGLFVLLFILAAGVGCIVHILVERPVLSVAKRLTTWQSPELKPATASES